MYLLIFIESLMSSERASIFEIAEVFIIVCKYIKVVLIWACKNGVAFSLFLDIIIENLTQLAESTKRENTHTYREKKRTDTKKEKI